MKLSFEFFRNNTDEHLFNKTLKSYERFPVLCRGGPLMAYLLLSKILTTTESAIEILMAKIKSLKIRDSKGEDVDAVVSLVRSTVDVLLSASDVGRNYIPDDFPKTILQVFQSSSNKEFNETFAEEQRTVQRESDRNGTKPLWPTVEGTLLQAERVYQRLVTEGAWCVSASKKRAALNVRESTPSDKPPGNLALRTCWNCGKQGCSVQVCKKPKDQNKIEANRKKFLKAKQSKQRSSNRSNSGQTNKKDAAGRPLKHNKHGVLVIDTKRLQDQKQAALVNTLSELERSSNSNDTTPPPPPVSDAATGTTTEAPQQTAFQLQLARAQQQVSTLYSTSRN